MRTSWTIPTFRLSHGVAVLGRAVAGQRFGIADRRRASSGFACASGSPRTPGAVDAPLGRRQERGDALHDHRRDEALGGSPIGVRRQQLATAGTARPTRTVTWPPGRGSFWPLGQTRCEPAIPSGTIGAPVRSARAATPSCASWSEPSGLRVPSGKTNRTWPSSRIRLARRKASTSAGAAVDRVDAAVGRRPADDRPGEQLLLAEPMDAPAEPRHQPRAEHDRVEVRGVVRGEDERPVASGSRRSRPRP